jgi:UDP-N-acetylmuramoyl-tripeptide--D-alanyl-D-alanine ligase
MMSLEAVAHALEGTIQGGDPSAVVRGVSTDTRTLREGELFFALRGPRQDGHDYVHEALSRGARAAVVESDCTGTGPCIVVRNTTAALGALAAAYRTALPARVVAVTGTNGKTSPKEMIAHLLAREAAVVKAPASYNNHLGVLRERFPILMTSGNLNNHIGVPLTILSASPSTEYLVLEVGTNAPGEIEALGRIARPDVAVITSVSEGHLEGLRTVQDVAREKGSLLQWIRTGGHAVLNYDNPYTRELSRQTLSNFTFGLSEGATLRATQVRERDVWVRFIVNDVPFRIKLASLAHLTNALAALAVAQAFDISLEECSLRFLDFKPPSMRMERVRVDGVVFLNDAYNANPASMRSALAAFSRMRSTGRRVAVLGDMKELGDDSVRYHREIVRFAAALGFDLLLLVGPLMQRAGEFLMGQVDWAPCADADEAARLLSALLIPNDLVLLKGSRAMRLERVLSHCETVLQGSPSGRILSMPGPRMPESQVG